MNFTSLTLILLIELQSPPQAPTIENLRGSGVIPESVYVSKFNPDHFELIDTRHQYPVEEFDTLDKIHFFADRLWDDYGDPRINYTNQWSTLHTLEGLARPIDPLILERNLPPEKVNQLIRAYPPPAADELRVLSDVIVDYIEQGGINVMATESDTLNTLLDVLTLTSAANDGRARSAARIVAARLLETAEPGSTVRELRELAQRWQTDPIDIATYALQRRQRHLDQLLPFVDDLPAPILLALEQAIVGDYPELLDTLIQQDMEQDSVLTQEDQMVTPVGTVSQGATDSNQATASTRSDARSNSQPDNAPRNKPRISDLRRALRKLLVERGDSSRVSSIMELTLAFEARNRPMAVKMTARTFLQLLEHPARLEPAVQQALCEHSKRLIPELPRTASGDATRKKLESATTDRQQARAR